MRITFMVLFLNMVYMCNAQEEPDTAYWEEPDTTSYAFEQFIGLFTGGMTPIPYEVVLQFMNSDETFGNEESTYYAKEILDDSPNYVLVTITLEPAGPGVEHITVYTYTTDGILLNTEQLGSTYSSSGPDGEGLETVYAYNKKNTSIKVTKNITYWNPETEEEEKRDEFSFYQIDSAVIISLHEGRLYPAASERILLPEELEGFTSEELLIMRNEIFAGHGYIFKTEPLKTYFSTLPWYEPAYDKVDDLLTEIEEENLREILAAEKKLKEKK